MYVPSSQLDGEVEIVLRVAQPCMELADVVFQQQPLPLFGLRLLFFLVGARAIYHAGTLARQGVEFIHDLLELLDGHAK